MKTCKWCGKQFDSSQACCGGVSHNYWYCSKRCENAGERAREKECQKDKENFERVFGQNSYDRLRSFLILAVLGGIVFVIIVAWIWSILENNTTEVQEVVNAQQQTEQVIKLPEQAIPVASQSELDGIGEESNNNIMSELLGKPEDLTEVIENEENTGFDEMGLEETVRPDFSRQRVYQSFEVDEEPRFPGGERGLLDYIAENVVFPQTAIDEGAQGRVFVGFVIDPDGIVSNAKVLRGIGYGCDEEAIRVVESLPNWEPGRRRNKAVRVSMTVPVIFELK